MISARDLLALDLLVATDLVSNPGSLGAVKHRGSLLWMALRLADILAIKICLND